MIRHRRASPDQSAEHQSPDDLRLAFSPSMISTGLPYKRVGRSWTNGGRTSESCSGHWLPPESRGQSRSDSNRRLIQFGKMYYAGRIDDGWKWHERILRALRPGDLDPVSNVLKWVLLVVAVVSFALFGWATVLTYERAPPQPDRMVTSAGATLMTNENILVGKAGFQRADLMDYGSLYGMGSYFGQDYTAWTLIRLARLVQNNLAKQFWQAV